ncbi:MAG: type II toxin-antitoxin system PemK/MazF family toxin [Bacillota bacterium]|nr:type II toxin-antitoxin system PemK/MazF family toxin [Bacillota bacterium]
MSIKKGDLYFADLSPVMGSEQGGVRPVLVVQNDVGNKFSPTIIVAAITSQNKASLPTHVNIEADGTGLAKNSVILLEQLRTIDKRRLKERIGTIDKTRLPEVNEALSVSLGIDNGSFF